MEKQELLWVSKANSTFCTSNAPNMLELCTFTWIDRDVDTTGHGKTGFVWVSKANSTFCSSTAAKVLELCAITWIDRDVDTARHGED